MRCATCGSDNAERAKFCIECAAPFPKRCPTCATENPPQAKFCAECATPLTAQFSPPGPGFTFQVPRSQPPVAYTPKHLAERILAEQAALETRGATEKLLINCLGQPFQ